jgi:flagellar hook-length control protein FliK
VNAALPVAAAASLPASANAISETPGTVVEGVPDGAADASFRGVLDRQMQRDEAAAPAVPGSPDGVPTVSEANIQVSDSAALNLESLASFLDAQMARQVLSGAAAGGGADAAGAQSLSDRDGPLGLPGAGAAAGAAQAALSVQTQLSALRGDAQAVAAAATGADSGKPLPPVAAEFAATMRALSADIRSAERPERALLDAGNLANALTPQVAGTAAETAGAHLPGGTSAAQQAPEARATTHVATPLGRPEWAGALSDKVTWLVGQRVQVADIQITPPQLGPVEVRISIQNDQASIAFVSGHAVVRDALQAALPRLGELFAQSGLSLGQTSVGAESFQGQQQGFQQPDGARRDGDGLPATDGHALASAAGIPGLRVVSAPRPGIDMFV